MSGTSAIGATSNTSSVSNSSSSDPLSSLTSNFQDFLSMLTTQLQNQDPTSPMDPSQFTTELVEFTGVEAQIQTNTSLSQLIQLAQGNSVMQSEALVGKQVQVDSSQLSLQNSQASVSFTAPSAGAAQVTVSTAGGVPVYSSTISAAQGANTWTWNGQGSNGMAEPDGAYNVSVAQVGAGGTSSSLPFTVGGTVTGVQQQNGTVELQLGSLDVGIGSLASVQD